MTFGIDFASILVALRYSFPKKSQLIFERIPVSILSGFVWNLGSKGRVTGSRFAPLFATFSQGILLEVPCYILDGFGLHFGA